MPSIDALTGNYFTRQELDLLQSVRDRLSTPIGTRNILTTYGFPVYEWVDRPRAEIEQLFTDTVSQDGRVDSVTFNYRVLGRIEVDVNSLVRVRF